MSSLEANKTQKCLTNVPRQWHCNIKNNGFENSWPQHREVFTWSSPGVCYWPVVLKLTRRAADCPWMTLRPRNGQRCISGTAPYIWRSEDKHHQTTTAFCFSTKRGNTENSIITLLLTPLLTVQAAGIITILYVHCYVDSSRLLEINACFFLNVLLQSYF